MPISTRPLRNLWHTILGKPVPLAARLNATLADVSVLATYYTTGHRLINTGTGTSDGVRYGMYLTTEPDESLGPAFVTGITVIYVLNLPFASQAHLLGIGKKYPADRTQFAAFLAGTPMTNVVLDANLASMVDIYTDTHQHFQAQYAPDPDALAFIKKYCAGRIWEIRGSELYIVVPNDRIGMGNVIIESLSFVQAIRPALPVAPPDTPINHRELPYDIYDGPLLNCPLCKQRLSLQEDKWFLCKQGHGALITDTELHRLDTHTLSIIIENRHTVHHGPLTCPHCARTMQGITHHSTEIYSCTNCAFHWLDANAAGSLSVSPSTAAHSGI